MGEYKLLDKNKDNISIKKSFEYGVCRVFEGTDGQQRSGLRFNMLCGDHAYQADRKRAPSPTTF